MALLFLWIHQRRGEGGLAACATACPYNSAQAYIHNHYDDDIPFTWNYTHWELHPVDGVVFAGLTLINHK